MVNHSYPGQAGEAHVVQGVVHDEARAMASEYAERPQAFLHKPFQMNELKETLEQVLGVDKGQLG